MQYTLYSFLSNFPAIAIPFALDSPCPNDPVDISTPGIFFLSGCPCNLPSMLLNVFSSSVLKYPLFANAAYNAGAQCPFDSTSLSLSFHSGSCGFIFISLKYNTAIISATDNDPPGCPDW